MWFARVAIARPGVICSGLAPRRVRPAALGFYPGHQIHVNDAWQDATTAAVERRQDSLNEM